MKNIYALFVLIAFVATSVAFANDADKTELIIKNGVAAKVPFNPPKDELSVALWVKVEMPQHFNSIMGSPIAIAGNGFDCGFSLILHSCVDGTFFPRFSIGAVNSVGLNGRDPGADNLIKRAAASNRDSTIVAGRWYHFAGTWDGVNVKLYLDGKLIATDFTNRGYVRKHAEKFEAGSTLWWGEVRPLPHLSEKVAVWAHPLSEAEIAKLAADRPKLPDTPELASLLERTFGGERISAKQLLAQLGDQPISPKGRAVFDYALAYGYLIDGELEKAIAAKDRYLADVKLSRYTDFAVHDIEFNFIEGMRKYGFVNEAAERLCVIWTAAKAKREVWAPIAAKEYAAVLRQAGRTDDAAAIEREAVAINTTGFYPQVNTEAGVAAAYNARPQAGARVSLAMPKTAFYVATDGDDASEGSEAHPFATFSRARTAVRALKTKGLPRGGVAVIVRGGTYAMKETLQLEAEDSGTESDPIVWCAAEDERVVLSGAWDIPDLEKPAADDPVMQRVPVEAREKVRVADVRGYPRWNEKMKVYRSGNYRVDEPELFLGNRRLTPARYPNDSWLTVSATSGETSMGKYGNHIARGKAICKELEGELERWAKEKELFVTGYWRLHWSDLTSEVKSIDPKTGIIEIDRNPEIIPRGSFFFLNAATALDAPGEWFLDRMTGRLYVIEPERGFWSTLFGAKGKYRLASFAKPFIEVRNVKNLRIEGLVLECGRAEAMVLSNCCDTVVAGNVVRHFGGCGLSSKASKNVTVRDNIFHSFASGAVELFGGDRKTLTSSGCVIANNRIYDIENRVRTYRPCIELRGVGTEVNGNELFNAPSSAMRLEGNDFWVVSNYIHHCVLESDDQGVFDIYRDPSYAGMRFCWNVFEESSWTIPKGFARHVFRGGIRFDGNISGQTVYANRFRHIGTGEFGAVGSCGGRLNVIDNNIIDHCARGMSFGVYPMNYWTNAIRKSISHLALDAEKGVDIRKPPYATRYPGIAKLFETDQINYLTRNVVIGPTPIAYSPPFPTVFRFNRNLAEEPVWQEFERHSSFAHVPTAAEVGPKPTAAFRRAEANDRE